MRAVGRGQRVFIGSACAEPRGLVSALMGRVDDLNDVTLLHFVTLGRAEYTDKRFDRRFRHNAFFIGESTRQAVGSARADYTPVFMHQIAALFRTRQVELDVALIQVSPPDAHGFVSLGIGVDVARAAAESAGTVIAQVNRHMPRTMGNTYLRVSDIDVFVEQDQELLEFVYPPADQVGQRIDLKGLGQVGDFVGQRHLDAAGGLGRNGTEGAATAAQADHLGQAGHQHFDTGRGLIPVHGHRHQRLVIAVGDDAGLVGCQGYAHLGGHSPADAVVGDPVFIARTGCHQQAVRLPFLGSGAAAGVDDLSGGGVIGVAVIHDYLPNPGGSQSPVCLIDRLTLPEFPEKP